MVKFIRMNFKASSPKVLDAMWNDKRIAIDYEPIESSNPALYRSSSAKRACERINELARAGGYVVAEFPNHRDRLLIGQVKAESKVEVREYDNYPYKTVQMEDCKEILYKDFPNFLNAKPRRGTIVNATLLEKDVLELFSKSETRPTAYSLSCYGSEDLAKNYLIKQGVLEYILSAATSCRDIDIIGYTKTDDTVIGQVTFSTSISEVHDKLKRLVSWENNWQHRYFFGPKLLMDNLKAEYHGKCHLISIEEVFDLFGPDHPLIQHLIPRKHDSLQLKRP